MSSSPSEAESLACPRCKSRDTKFCYFNNYSTAQPRHFCKNCKRYWTAGGSLRNVPVGGGLRKSKKSKLSKHGKDLLSASAEELLNSSHHTATSSTGLPIASPTSSAEGVVDEAFSTSMMPPLLGAYRPTFEFASEGLDCTPLPTPSHSFHHMNLTQNCEEGHGNALLQNSHYQLAAHEAGNGFYHPQHWYGSMDQAHSNYGEISSEPSQESGRGAMIFSSMNTGSSTFQRYDEHERRDIKAQRAGLRQNTIDEKKISCSKQQGIIECSADDHYHDGVLKKMSMVKDEDELGLGNVINVRYPYDWEQVSEVLFGGTPDFFQMPTF